MLAVSRWSLALLLVAAPASAQTITFEDLGGQNFTGLVPTSYQGFTWSGDVSGAWATGQPGDFFTTPIGAGTVSAWSNAGAALYVSRATPFSFTSTLIRARNGMCASPTAPTQIVNGYYLGALVGTMSFGLNCSAYETRVFGAGFSTIDQLRFERTTPNPTNIYLDNLVFGAAAVTPTVAPEPATLAFVGFGLLSVFGAGAVRKRRTP
ncbi:MAG: hypothetical protein ABJB74_21905 [Gemmatimonas sp.]